MRWCVGAAGNRENMEGWQDLALRWSIMTPLFSADSVETLIHRKRRPWLSHVLLLCLSLEVNIDHIFFRDNFFLIFSVQKNFFCSLQQIAFVYLVHLKLGWVTEIYCSVELA